MATTTASVAISSSDLQVGNTLSINASSTLMQSGLTTGLEIMDMGKKLIEIKLVGFTYVIMLQTILFI
jgi:hypothetical protein